MEHRLPNLRVHHDANIPDGHTSSLVSTYFRRRPGLCCQLVAFMTCRGRVAEVRQDEHLKSPAMAPERNMEDVQNSSSWLSYRQYALCAAPCLALNTDGKNFCNTCATLLFRSDRLAAIRKSHVIACRPNTKRCIPLRSGPVMQRLQ